MAVDGGQRFRVRFPVITLSHHYGGKRAIVLWSVKPKDDTSEVAITTLMDITGRVHTNVPVLLRDIKAAFLRPSLFVEMPDDGGLAPVSGGLVGGDGKPL